MPCTQCESEYILQAFLRKGGSARYREQGSASKDTEVICGLRQTPGSTKNAVPVRGGIWHKGQYGTSVPSDEGNAVAEDVHGEEACVQKESQTGRWGMQESVKTTILNQKLRTVFGQATSPTSGHAPDSVICVLFWICIRGR